MTADDKRRPSQADEENLRRALSRLSAAQAADEPSKDQLQRIMQRAVARREAQEASPWRVLRALWLPRFRVSLGGVMLASLSVAVTAVSLVAWNQRSSRSVQSAVVEREPPPSQAASEEVSEGVGAVPVRFMLPAAGATSVSVVGDFNGWQTDAAVLDDVDGDGVFVTTLLLPRGSYGYMFVIDGERWTLDPYATNTRDDGFGQRNAVIRVN